MKVVIDTNVAIVANGRDTHANLNCQHACINFLESIVATRSRAKIVLDAGGMILDEYKDHLSYGGQPGVGDIFFKYLHDHMYQGKKIQLVAVNKNLDEDRGFDELPANEIDKSDRKFLAVAIVSKANVMNAVDTDWHAQRDLVDSLGVVVRQLCPEYGCG